MHLEQISIYNYRSCRNLSVSFNRDKPNIFIGLNDSGKSTILNAINLLFESKPKFNHLVGGSNKNDISNSPISIVEINKELVTLNLPEIDISEDACLIIGKLVYLDDEADEFSKLNLSTSLMWSIESNEPNSFWIGKLFAPSGDRFLVLQNDSLSDKQLWTKTQADINKAVKMAKVTDKDIENENGVGRFSNFEKIRAVYGKEKTRLIWSDYKFAKGDKEIFPGFALYDWDTSLEDIKNTANDIMRDQIAKYLDPIKMIAQTEADKAETEINKKFGELKDIIKTVATDVEEISSKVYFDVSEKISDIMLKKSNSDGQIHLENQGEGLKRQIWFSLIKAKASDQSEGPNKFIWAFDEPETHLYPAAQRDFFDILKQLSSGNVQSIISTHSTVFIDKSQLKLIHSTRQGDDGYTLLDTCHNVDSIFETLNIRNSDFLFYDKFLVVEGETEEFLIPKLYEYYSGVSLIDANIQLIKAKGKSNWTQTKDMLERLMSGFRKPDDRIYYLFDADAIHSIGVDAKTDKMYFVGQQDIEDSFSDDVWLRILNDYYEDQMIFDIDWMKSCRDKIVEGERCPKNKKMDQILRSSIRAKWIEEGHEAGTEKRIPKKAASADFLFSGITSKDDIPQSIRTCFDKIIH